MLLALGFVSLAVGAICAVVYLACVVALVVLHPLVGLPFLALSLYAAGSIRKTWKES